MSEWRFELRIRYLPSDLTDLYDRDKVTFGYYYEQVQYFKLKMASIEIRGGRRGQQGRLPPLDSRICGYLILFRVLAASKAVLGGF